MFLPSFALRLTAGERAELDAMTRATRIPAGLARRARLILALAAGTAYETITAQLGFAPSSISRWKQRFHRARVMGLRDAPRAGRPDRLAPALEVKIIAVTQQPPPTPYTHWSVRRLARRLGVSRATVHRVWQRAGLKPRLRCLFCRVTLRGQKSLPPLIRGSSGRSATTCASAGERPKHVRGGHRG